MNGGNQVVCQVLQLDFVHVELILRSHRDVVNKHGGISPSVFGAVFQSKYDVLRLFGPLNRIHAIKPASNLKGAGECVIAVRILKLKRRDLRSVTYLLHIKLSAIGHFFLRSFAQDRIHGNATTT